MSYTDFLESKIKLAEDCGFEVDPSILHPSCLPHQVDTIIWAARKGRALIASSFGLGKTQTQIELLRVIQEATGGAVLIVCPLGVKHQFTQEDGPRLGVQIQYVRNDADVLTTDTPFLITNYERVRDGHFSEAFLAGLAAVSLDEGSVLRSVGSETHQQFTRLLANVPFRFVCTATPSPNRYTELNHYAAFLGVMDSGQALTRWFRRDSQKAGNLTLHPQHEADYWLWVSSWALFLTRPSDLGYSDEGYDLPALQVHWHLVTDGEGEVHIDRRSGQSEVFHVAGGNLPAAAKEKKRSIGARLAKACDIILNEQPDLKWLLWHHLEEERKAIEDFIPQCTYNSWVEYRDGHPTAIELYNRHYSAYEYKDGRERKLISGPGEKMVLLTNDSKALFVWRKFIDDCIDEQTGEKQAGVNCAVFRNENKALLSSDLIQEAMQIAWLRWPDERLYTYVDADKVDSDNPGYCFKKAGWNICGATKNGKLILAIHPAEVVNPVAVTRRRHLGTVYGSQELELREELILGFSRGEYDILATKPEIAGSGCNFQKYCHMNLFLGIDYRFEDFIQAVHRTHRFQQQHPVQVHILYTPAEEPIRKELEAKWQRHTELMENMRTIIQTYGLSHAVAKDKLSRSMGVERQEAKGQLFTAVHNDCVAELQTMTSNSVDLIHTSIPFGNHYEYSASYNDFGHNEDNEKFFAQMDFLVPELLRVLKPGRIAAIHVKDRVRYGSMTGDGFITLDPFSDQTTAVFRKHGFRLMGRITVLTDVVRENNQTYRLGYTEMCKDGSKMGVGLPEYVLLLRKLPSDQSNGYADQPVQKEKSAYSLARWQVDAHALWRSSGERLLTPDELRSRSMDRIGQWWKARNLFAPYDYAEHVRIGEGLEQAKRLPSSFMMLAPQSPHPEVWTDIVYMRTLNGEQSKRNVQNHICPLPFDIVDRVIERWSNAGEVILDPFGGLMTVPFRAVTLGRRGYGVELNPEYWKCGVQYCREAEYKATVPTLFGLLDAETRKEEVAA